MTTNDDHYCTVLIPLGIEVFTLGVATGASDASVVTIPPGNSVLCTKGTIKGSYVACPQKHGRAETAIARSCGNGGNEVR